MPCYNVAKYIRESIVSIINQSFKDWELIIIDDASTDNTIEIIEEINDKRLKLFRLNQNIGNYRARNFGICKAKGKYIAMFDADDISLPQRLQMQFDYLEKHKGVGAIGSNYNLIDEHGKIFSKIDRSCSYIDFQMTLLANNFMLQSTIFIRSHLLKKHNIKYDERFKYASDYYFVFHCAKFFRIFNINQTLVSYRLRSDGITGSKYYEQQKFASQIRKEIILYYLGSSMTSFEIDLVCVIVTNQKPRETKINFFEIERTLNKVLAINHERKVFPQHKLYNYLGQAVLNFLQKNQKQH